jgi:membrane associated rhomboid family serine protease
MEAMIILPLGHDKEIFHFPYVTLGIIVICLGLQVYGSIREPSEEQLRQQQREMMLLHTKIWAEHGRKWAEQRHPELFQHRKKSPPSAGEMLRMVTQMRRVQLQFFEEYEAGRVVDRTDEDYRRLQELKRQRQEAVGLLAHGYRWGGKLYTLVAYAFIHAGWFHLIGNMLFLYLCGCNLEDRWGRVVWVVLYLVGAVTAALAWGLLQRQTQIPLVGASGAIAAAMGAFLVVNYNANIRFFYFLWWFTYPIRGTFYMKAYWALPLWLVQQVLGMWSEGRLTAVAYSAHVGGFACGLVFAALVKAIGADRRLRQASEDRATLYQEHPLYLQGLTFIERGNREAAESAFERLLQERPDHTAAALELYRLKRSPVEAARAASRAVVLARRSGDLSTPLTVYTDMNQRHPDAALDDRSLFAIGECYEKGDNPQAAIDVYQRLLELHPESPVAARALLNVATIYSDRLRDPYRAQEILTRVLQAYGGTPFAERAREMLSQLSPR